MKIEKLADVLSEAIKDKLFSFEFQSSVLDPFISCLTFQKGNNTYSIEGYVKMKGDKITFIKIDKVIQYHIAVGAELELDYTEKEKKQLMYHLYKIEL